MRVPFSVYRQGKQANIINCSVLQIKDGWRVRVLMPEQVSTSDRIKVLDWLHSYRSEILKQHPFWITVFNASDEEYLLDVIQTDDAKGMVAHMIDSSQASIQLEFEFNYE